MSTFEIMDGQPLLQKQTPKKLARHLEVKARMEANGGRRGPYKKNKVTELFEASGWKPTQEIARELFNYDEETGVLTRRINRSGNKGRAGEVAGIVNKDSGYLMVKFGKELCQYTELFIFGIMATALRMK